MLITSLDQYLNKLEKLTFVSADDKKLYTKEGYIVSIKCHFLNETGQDDYPVQVVLHVSTKDITNISRFGCTDNKENATLTRWFFKKYYKFQSTAFSDSMESRRQARKKFEKITE